MDAPLPPNLDREFAAFFETDDKSSKFDLTIFDHPVLFPLQRQCEAIKMIDTVRCQCNGPKVIYEIGTDKGGSLYQWCKNFPTLTHVIACEIRGTPYSKEFEKRFPHINFLWIEDSSYAPEIVKRVKDWLGDLTIDALFIDGDKARFHVDFDFYRDCVSSPGIIMMHDITEGPPQNSYVRVLKGGYRHSELVDLADTFKALLKDNPESCHDGWLREWRGRSCGVGFIYV